MISLYSGRSRSYYNKYQMLEIEKLKQEVYKQVE